MDPLSLQREKVQDCSKWVENTEKLDEQSIKSMGSVIKAKFMEMIQYVTNTHSYFLVQFVVSFSKKIYQFQNLPQNNDNNNNNRLKSRITRFNNKQLDNEIVNLIKRTKILKSVSTSSLPYSAIKEKNEQLKSNVKTSNPSTPNKNKNKNKNPKIRACKYGRDCKSKDAKHYYDFVHFGHSKSDDYISQYKRKLREIEKQEKIQRFMKNHNILTYNTIDKENNNDNSNEKQNKNKMSKEDIKKKEDELRAIGLEEDEIAELGVIVE